ncbi:hypothetical protein HU200_067000 [Digitaria exilis]|uniref:Uncharacterized protein n=1 Tax=Digitaria exilis TaxID=1010633 RepID=A0A834ZZC5_9POAL|nr:hypothetical protein HU200_067000 [Digitaria exilis]
MPLQSLVLDYVNNGCLGDHRLLNRKFFHMNDVQWHQDDDQETLRSPLLETADWTDAVHIGRTSSDVTDRHTIGTRRGLQFIGPRQDRDNILGVTMRPLATGSRWQPERQGQEGVTDITLRDTASQKHEQRTPQLHYENIAMDDCGHPVIVDIEVLPQDRAPMNGASKVTIKDCPFNNSSLRHPRPRGIASGAHTWDNCHRCEYNGHQNNKTMRGLPERQGHATVCLRTLACF